MAIAEVQKPEKGIFTSDFFGSIVRHWSVRCFFIAQPSDTMIGECVRANNPT
jgi:hypothetical protein